jgi:8-oxo-dGTP pyrophosphatase MutT (NUDIX family)
MSKATSNRARKTIAVSALIFDELCRCILLVKNRPDKRGQYYGGWGLPTGGVEFNETPERALVRETENESGYPVTRIVGLLGEYPKGPRHTLLLYLVEVEDFPQAIKEREEIETAKFIPIREILGMPYATSKRNNGIYLSTVSRLIDALEVLAATNPEELEDGSAEAAFRPWLCENQERLRAVVEELEREGLLKRGDGKLQHAPSFPFAYAKKSVSQN